MRRDVRRFGILIACLACLAAWSQHQAARKTKPASGTFLVASPRLLDPNFSQTVVLLTKYDAEGAMGFVINRPSEVPISHAVPELSESPRAADRVFIGGPVAPNELFLLVRSKKKPGESIHIDGDLWFSRSHDVLKRLLDGGKSFRLLAGYAGWAGGQLDIELERGDWRVLPADSDSVFYEEGPAWRRLLPPDPAKSADLERPDRTRPRS